MPRILLAVMPFLPLHRPALGVSALKASCERAGLACDVRYFTFDYAELVGLKDYVRLDGGLPTQNLTGEWVFSLAAFGDAAPPAELFEADVLRRSPPGFYDAAFIDRLRRMPALGPGFVRRCVDAIDLGAYDIIGFTSTFQQNCASIALAREIKGRAPEIVTVFGGGNCDGVMGPAWLERVPWFDVVVSGEADFTFPNLVELLRSGQDITALPGVRTRGPGPRKPSGFVSDMDALPVPDFKDYFGALAAFDRQDALSLELSFESSRGCWWGQKHHCTFCGLNGTTMAYRSKSPERAYDELRTLADTWKIDRLFASDNIINPRYFGPVFGRLLSDGRQLDLRYEMKSSLKREQLRLMRQSGTTWLQPGIESLSSRVLRLMDKGVKAITNVQTLKWAREMGLRVTWNCLCGFPDERAEDYEGMLATMRRLTHLMPPASFAVFRLDRFSPLFDQAETRGLRNVRAGRAYGHCYPFPPETLDRIAYFFDYDRSIDPDTLRAINEAWRFCNTEWQAYQGTSVLAARVSDSFVLVHDTRRGWPARQEVLFGVDRAVLMAADAAQTAPNILAIVEARQPELAADPDDVDAALDRLLEAGWMMQEGDLYLSLPVFSGCDDAELGAPRGPAPAAREVALAVH